MASSVREQIMGKLATLLTSASGFTFYRSRVAAVARTEGLVGILLPGEEEVEYKASRLTRRTLVIKITVLARGSIPDSEADPAIVAIHAAIMADMTLGGLCGLIIDESTNWQLEVADQTAAEIEMRYSIIYSTAVNDLTKTAGL